MGKAINYEACVTSVQTLLLLRRKPQEGAEVPKVTELSPEPRAPTLSQPLPTMTIDGGPGQGGYANPLPPRGFVSLEKGQQSPLRV